MPLKALISPKLVDSAFIFLQALYLIRYPLLIFVLIAAFMPATIYFFLKTLMANLYDLEGFLPTFWFSLSAFLLSFSTATALKLTLLYGGERIEFDADTRRRLSDRSTKYALSSLFFFVSIILTGVLISGVFIFSYNSPSDGDSVLPRQIAGTLAGFFAAIVLLLLADVLQRLINRKSNAESLDRFLFPFRNPLAAWANRSEYFHRLSNRVFRPSFLERHFRVVPTYLGRGYLRYKDDGSVEVDEEGRASINPGHFTAVALFFFFFVVYMVVGWLIPMFARDSLHVTAISYVMILLTLLVWGLTGLSFFLDRYRFPVLLAVVPLFLLTSLPENNDYVFSVMKPKKPVAALTPADVLDKPHPLSTDSPGEDYVIVVAANGGGIQAATWTAKVLTGIEEECKRAFGDGFHGCASKIRLISSVSGGSVGAMYFANSYTRDGISRNSYREIVDKASRSSLDSVAWGLVYPDFNRSFIPFYPGTYGRGQALEARWADGDAGLTDGLSTWREGVGEGWRPATIFNATIVESGERMLISTTDICEKVIISNGTNGTHTANDKTIDECEVRGTELRSSLNPNAEIVKVATGRTGFRNFYKNGDGELDIPVVTAARLSASFPYVTPAPRAEVEDCKLRKCVHIVDGGYYDNYGMSSLMEWLNEALSYSKTRRVKHVMIVQIRGDQVGVAEARADSSPAPYYQSVAPLLTMLNVRNTGQLSHNDAELDIFRRYWETQDINIETAVFEFGRVGQDGPPLSWHLSGKEKKDVENGWQSIRCGSDEKNPWVNFRGFIESRAGRKGVPIDPVDEKCREYWAAAKSPR